MYMYYMQFSRRQLSVCDEHSIGFGSTVSTLVRISGRYALVVHFVFFTFIVYQYIPVFDVINWIFLLLVYLNFPSVL